MNIPSVETDNRSSSTSSTMIDDDNMSIVVNDSSDTTVATQTSSSWHSVVSDVQINNNLFIRSQSINNWIKTCLIEPDIRLTTAQEWKLRSCIRRFLSICNLPLKISCIKVKEYESIPFIDQEQQPLMRINDDEDNDQLQYLGLYLHKLSLSDTNNNLLDIKLFEFYFENSEKKSIKHIPIIKSPKFLFYISLNILQLTLRSTDSLVELKFSTRENELIRGYYYKWNENKNEHMKFNITIEVDQSLINEFNT